jgi:2-keto-4-pentenoate hydratase
MAEPVWGDQRVVAGMRQQLERRDRELQEGARPVGWKVAFGVPATQAALGISGPTVGYLTDRTLLESGGRCSLAGWAKPVLEAEISVRMGAEVPAGAEPEVAARAIESLSPAIELADIDPPPGPDRLDEVLAGGIYHRHYVLCPAGTERPGARTDDLRVKVEANGEERAATGDPERDTGRLPFLIAHVAEYLRAFGETLEAGQVVICGSTIPLIDLVPGERFLYALDPIGAVEVALER